MCAFLDASTSAGTTCPWSTSVCTADTSAVPTAACNVFCACSMTCCAFLLPVGETALQMADGPGDYHGGDRMRQRDGQLMQHRFTGRPPYGGI